MDIVQMVLAGKVNKDLVHLLQHHNGRAVGLCGLDGGMMQAEKLISGEDLGFVGEIIRVNTDIITNATGNGYVPIFPPLRAAAMGRFTTSTRT
jgi:acetylglutamate kinase